MRTRTTSLIVAGIFAGAIIMVGCSAASSASVGTPAGDVGTSVPEATQPIASPTSVPPTAPAPTSTPVAVATVAAVPTVAPVPTVAVPAAPPPPPAPPSSPQTISIDLEDNYFTSKQLSVPAGVSITVTIHNEGQALHNWDVTGVVKSNFLQHGQAQEVTFTGAPGTYAFQCDVHPKEMTGVLVVQ